MLQTLRSRTAFPIRALVSLMALPALCQAQQRPNVIVVLTDDQGYGDLSAHGNPVLKTPNLDKLHSQSIRFTDFHVAPMCTPTRSQLLTGRDAIDNGASFVCMGRSLIREELPTLADIFQDAGYATGHFGKWHLGDNYPFRPQDRGFQETVHHGAWGITSLADYFGNDYFNDHYRHNGRIEQYTGYCTDVWFQEAMSWIRRQARAEKPFLVYLPTNAPHVPLWVPNEYIDPYLGEVESRVAKFFGMIANIDENMGRLTGLLDKLGIADDTIFVFAGDNGTAQGEAVFNAGMRGKKRSLYEGGHRVPLFVRWPAGEIGVPRDIGTLTHVQDILPTLLDLSGVPAPAQAAFDGVSLAPLLKGQQQDLSERMLVVQYGGVFEKDRDAAVMWERWRLINGMELYDLSKDPGQRNDVSGDFPDTVAKMREHYDAWWNELMPAAEAYQPIAVGARAENPARLNASDWNGVYCDNPRCVRGGQRLSGPWRIRVERPGRYRFSLRRWPKESGLALRDPAEPLQGKYGDLIAGKALPITDARLRVGDTEMHRRVNRDDQQVVFETELESGEMQLQSWFLDEAGELLAGAFYVEVERVVNAAHATDSASLCPPSDSSCLDQRK
ncbi:MAG: arylsulfatase [Bryobacterales bacterium]|nr:arylsulfatase [Bryobacterales bacterium]